MTTWVVFFGNWGANQQQSKYSDKIIDSFLYNMNFGRITSDSETNTPTEEKHLHQKKGTLTNVLTED